MLFGCIVLFKTTSLKLHAIYFIKYFSDRTERGLDRDPVLEARPDERGTGRGDLEVGRGRGQDPQRREGDPGRESAGTGTGQEDLDLGVGIGGM